MLLTWVESVFYLHSPTLIEINNYVLNKRHISEERKQWNGLRVPQCAGVRQSAPDRVRRSVQV